MPITIRVLIVLYLAGLPLRADEPPVSFAKEIAPILVGQCLVCHNARTAKGRYSIETFDAMMKGGESGAAVTPGDADFSNLVQLVESGDMPKEGDPLPPEQVALLKRWVAQGAKLDADRRGDERLAAIMPKPRQPRSPDVYPAPVPVTALAFSPDGSSLAVSGYREVLLFNPGDGSLVNRLQDLTERVYGLAFSPDGRLIAVAAGTPARLGEVKLFQADTGALVADLASAGDAFLAVAFSPDGTRLAAGGADRTLRFWNVSDGTEQGRIEDHADWVTAVAFSPDGKRVATGSRDKTAKVFDVDTRTPLATFGGHDDAVLGVLFSPDGDRVVSCGKDRRLRCWNISDLKQQWDRKFKGEVVALAPAGPERLVAGSGDRTALLLGYDGKNAEKLDGRLDWVHSVAATPEGKLIAVGSNDGTVTLRRSAKGEVLRTFPAMPPAP